MSWYEHHRFFYVCLDPVHVGAGGYRLGRVDNAIVREPGTNIPKVPGTSLSGAIRSYAAMAYGRLDAAGQQQRLKDKTKEERDPNNCPILYTFGTASDETEGEGSKAGAANLSDALILLFPVATTAGPRWITTQEQLISVGCSVSGAAATDDGKIAWTGITGSVVPKEINAGWLLLSVAGQAEVSAPAKLQDTELWKEVRNRILITTPRYFSMIVNSNLEVRTSVSINPETGAAADGFLFTYEAIPRGTWLFSDVVIDDYAAKFPPQTKQHKSETSLPQAWNSPFDVVSAGVKLLEFLGVGGMGTRGFGRMKAIAEVVLTASTNKGGR